MEEEEFLSIYLLKELNSVYSEARNSYVKLMM